MSVLQYHPQNWDDENFLSYLLEQGSRPVSARDQNIDESPSIIAEEYAPAGLGAFGTAI